MDRRRKILIAVVALVAGGLVVDKLLFSPWLLKWGALSEQTVQAEAEVGKFKATLAREKRVLEGWEKVRLLLSKERTPDVQTHFVSHLNDLCKRAGVKLDTQSSRTLRQGDFREYVYETKFKLTMAELVDLLVELHNSKEFLKPMRISVVSQYEREDRLDLDLKVSTIEHDPQPVKPGVKP